MGSKKAKKDWKASKSTRTSPRKQKAARDAEPEEDSHEQSQEPSQEPEPEPREELPEGEAAGPDGDGDGEKGEKVGTVWTPEQDEQIAAFFEENTFFYDMTNAEYKNKKKRENMILELARTMFNSGKLKISFQIIFPRQCFVEQCCSYSASVMNLLRNIYHYDNCS